MNYKYLQSMESNYIWEKYNAMLRKIVYLKDASKFGMVYFTSRTLIRKYRILIFQFYCACLLQNYSHTIITIETFS